jgi:uncharacterized membrane protein
MHCGVDEGAIVADQIVVQEWEAYFLALASASAALAGLVFVAMSLHPQQILVNPMTRARAFVTAFGFLTGVAWAFIMLMPARTFPGSSILLIAFGIVVSVFIVYRQFQIRKIGLNITRAIISDLLLLTPIAAGIIGLLQPQSALPFLLIAIAGGVGLFVLFAQSWTLVLHGMINTADTPRQQTPSENRSQGSDKG